MISLARFILKGPSQASLVAAAMAILGMLFMPAAWLSAAAIALVVLVQGVRPGTQVMVYALLGACAFAWLIFAAPQLAFYFVLFAWLPVWLPAVVLRQTVSLANSLLTVTALAMIAVLFMYLAFPGFSELFRPAFDEFVSRLAEQYQDTINLQQIQQAKELVLQLLPGLLASSMLFGAIVSLVLARWWQAVLYNPGGFGEEFRSVRLGKVSAGIAAAITVLAVAAGSDVLNALVMVVFTLYLVQGSSILHALSNGMQWNTFWLVMIYGLVFMIPHMVVLLVLAGLVDAFVDIRKRVLA